MITMKRMLLVAALVAAAFLPAVRLERAESAWGLRPVAAYACDPGTSSGCGG